MIHPITSTRGKREGKKLKSVSTFDVDLMDDKNKRQIYAAVPPDGIFSN